ESFKRTSEPKPHWNYRFLVSFRIRSSRKRPPRNVANFGFGTLVDHLMRKPRGCRAGNEADQAVKPELQRTAVRPARTVEIFGGGKRDHAHNQHADHGTNP